MNTEKLTEILIELESLIETDANGSNSSLLAKDQNIKAVKKKEKTKMKSGLF
jgi:hypothetical protein